MRPSKIKEKNDQVVALTLTIIIHAAIIAALFLVAAPKSDSHKTEALKTEMVGKLKSPEKA